jgi:hypothetical protein
MVRENEASEAEIWPISILSTTATVPYQYIWEEAHLG